MAELPFFARIWGARGTLASLSGYNSRYGGNTACVEITCGTRRLIFDGGSGLRMMGDDIMAHRATLPDGVTPDPIHLFFTHCHYDHISALPFFGPFFDPTVTVNLWSGHLEGPDKTRKMVENYMSPPYFPVGPEVFMASLEYHDFESGDVLEPVEGIAIRTMSLNHHDNCIGYRVEFDGRSICYMSDTTHIPDEPDQNIIDTCRDTDLMIYDATYTDEEFPQFWNFGHSTWQEGVRLAKAAGAERLCLFHHRPSRTDDALDEIGEQARKQFRKCEVGREGLVIAV
ncbi:MAG: MBL fold metallo-hydrolase [Pseudomonadota bacterium]